MKQQGSFTAQIVALARAAGHLEPDRGVRNPDFLASRLIDPTLRIVLWPGIRSAVRTAYERLAPGMYLYHQLRTRHIDSIVLQEASNGVRQLVILGAGLDSRPYRFAKQLSGVRIFEVDHPFTGARKRRRLAKAALASSHVHFVAMDFTRENLHDRLADAGVDIHLRTLFLWEGVVYYLPEASVRETLQILSGAARGSSLVFDYVMHDVIAHPDKHYGASGFLSYVARKGEPVLFGIAPQSLCAFLDGYGYRVQSHLGPAQLCNQYLVTTNAAKTDPVCDIFEIVCATRA